jgi:uncharacterized protein YndB with AHSA1/START domain
MANKKTEFIVEREFDAPKEVVFKAFSTAEAMGEWWGPVDRRNSVIKFDFRPGGIFHYKMEGAKDTMWAQFVYKKIQEPDLLEFISSFTNEQGEITRAPFPFTWPLEIHNSISFMEKNGKTTIVLSVIPINPNEEETTAFLNLFEGMNHGYGATFDELVKYLKTEKVK